MSEMVASGTTLGRVMRAAPRATKISTMPARPAHCPEIGGSVIRYAIVLRFVDGTVVHTDVAAGNTPATAKAAARALARSYRLDFPGFDVRFTRMEEAA